MVLHAHARSIEHPFRGLEAGGGVDMCNFVYAGRGPKLREDGVRECVCSWRRLPAGCADAPMDFFADAVHAEKPGTGWVLLPIWLYVIAKDFAERVSSDHVKRLHGFAADVRVNALGKVKGTRFVDEGQHGESKLRAHVVVCEHFAEVCGLSEAFHTPLTPQFVSTDWCS